MDAHRYEMYSAAASLYDGGWRATDKEGLIEEYGISGEDAEMICEYLQKFEDKVKKNDEVY